MAQVNDARAFDLRGRGNPNRQTTFDFLGAHTGGVDAFSISDVDAEQLRAAVARWTDQGYAISFGRTSDGGAVGVHLLAGGDKRSRYFHDAAEFEDFLTTIPGASKPK